MCKLPWPRCFAMVLEKQQDGAKKSNINMEKSASHRTGLYFFRMRADGRYNRMVRLSQKLKLKV